MAVIPGTTGNDTLAGTIDADIMNGLGGLDTLFGSLGADEINGGGGIDTVDYNDSDAGVTVNLVSESGSGGHADLDTYSSIENAVGSDFNDLLIGDSDANLLDGGAGDDQLTGGAGNDTLTGGTGTDLASYALSSAAVTINLTAGTASGGDAAGDVLTGIENIAGSVLGDSLTGDSLANFLIGDEGNDTLSGAGGADSLIGDEGDDLILGGLGNDTIDGGTGSDTVDYGTAIASVRVNLTTTVTSGAHGVDAITNVENIIGSDFNDSLTGNAEANVLVGGAGEDTLTGGAGIDLADYSGADDAVKVNLTTNNNSGSDADGDVLSEIENIDGSAFNDSLTGDTADNLLQGFDGNDSLLGGAGNDTLDGGTGSRDSMTGGTGDDLFMVDSTNDRISESATNGGYDRVLSSATYTLSVAVEELTLTGSGNLDGTGNSSANTLTGNTGNNLLSGSTGNDSIVAGAGNDTLNGGADIDTMFGGDGDDVYFIDELTDVISEVGFTGTETVNSAVTWTLATEFENLTLIGTTGATGTGNAGNNTINGNIGSNLLQGLNGDDLIVGDLTDSTLKGGNDTLDGGSGENTLIGGLGNDTYLITTGFDTVLEDLDSGTDQVISEQNYELDQNVENLVLTGSAATFGIGNGLANVITGNDNANLLEGDDGNDTIFGGIGNDSIDGGEGADSMTGGVGNDEYIVDDAGDQVIEGADAGVDRVIASVDYTLASNLEILTAQFEFGAINLTGNTRDNEIYGNNASNILAGSSGADTLEGFAAADTLNGGTGIDSMEGGDDDDLYFVDEALDLTVEFAGEGTDTVSSSLSWTLAEFVENLILTGSSGLSGTGNDDANTITGTTGANLLSGQGGADTLNGGDGNDTLNGGSGNDSMSGGNGNDTYLLSAAGDIIIEVADAGTDTVSAGFSHTLADNFENLVLTGSGDIDGTGNSVANNIAGTGGINALSGLGGNDTLTGGGGDDELDGGTGDDSMAGGIGADTYFVDSIADKVVEVSAKQIDTVFSTVTFTLASNVENLTLDAGNINGTGNSAANIIVGTSGTNILTGLGGNDTMTGNGGSDTLDGGTGNDNMTGGNGSDVYIVNSLADVVSEAGTTGTDRVESSVSFTLGTNVENLTLTGINRLNGTGNGDENVILGNGGINKLSGLAGDDTITGGLGADRFIFTGEGDDIDTITDFNGLVSGLADGDKLQFAASLLAGEFAYVGAADFTADDTNSEARMSAGSLFMDFDGDGISDMTILMTGLATEEQLLVTDFIFA
jgi:Ca2+-binding RTX toxin-like protein